MLIQLPGIFLMMSLIVSVLLCIFQNRFFARIIYVVFSFAMLIFSIIMLLCLFKESNQISYSFGSWNNGYGIDIVATKQSVLMLVMLCFVFFLTAYQITISKTIKTSAFGFFGLAFTGMSGLIFTGDLFNFYVFLELTSISLYIILTSSKNENSKDSYLSAFDYLIIGSIANIFILLGIYFMYSTTGMLNMAQIASLLQSNQYIKNILLIKTGYILMILGLIIKSGLYPLHSWIMRCYINIPSVVTAFIAGIVIKVMIFNIYKINNMFGYLFIIKKIHYLVTIIYIISYVSIIVFSIIALFSYNIKDILSFSSIGQSGYLLLSIFSFDQNIMNGAFLLMLGHSFAIVALFLVLNTLEKHTASVINIENFRSCIKHQKVLEIAFVVCILSSAGFPITLGFMGKLYTLTGFYIQGRYISFTIIIIGGGISMLYALRLIENMYFSSYKIKQVHYQYNISFSTKATVFGCAFLLILFGIFNTQILDLLTN